MRQNQANQALDPQTVTQLQEAFRERLRERPDASPTVQKPGSPGAKLEKLRETASTR
jgi:hypothetical protein